MAFTFVLIGLGMMSIFITPSSGRYIEFSREDVYCSCPFHRATRVGACGNESPNYEALSVQLRKSYDDKTVENQLTM